MTTGLKKGDKVRVVDNSDDFHNFKVGEIVEYQGKANKGFYECKRTGIETLRQTLKPYHFEKIEEDSTMAKKSNPKNFRNGDVIKVSDRRGNDAMVFVKFGENYYNLTAGGQMKACRYLPPGTKEIITNLSGMGKFFLMSEEELEEQAGKQPVGIKLSTDESPYGHTSTEFITATDIIQRWEDMTNQIYDTAQANKYIVTDTTEEK